MPETPPERSPNENPVSLADLIRARREELGITATELADRAGISKGYVHGLETGTNTKPSAQILFNVAEALDTTVAYLLGRRRTPEAQSSEGEIPVIPQSLRKFAEEEGLAENEVARLARIKYRGGQPKTTDDWRFLYGALKRTIRG
jgi:transcriptional regulator with XRE-family HTH domain